MKKCYLVTVGVLLAAFVANAAAETVNAAEGKLSEAGTAAVVPSSSDKAGAVDTAVPEVKLLPMKGSKKKEPVAEKKKKTAAPEPVVAPLSVPDRPLIDPRKAAKKAEQCLERVREYYVIGKLAEAGKEVDRCLSLDPQNEQAALFKSKIGRLQERRDEVRKDIAEECYYSAEYFYRRGNVLEAMLWINRALKLNPSSQKATALDYSITDASNNLVGSMSEGDRRKLMSAIRDFLNGDFDAAAGTFRSLRSYYSEVNDFLAVAMTHSADWHNAQRSREYLAEAINALEKDRFKKAQENLYLALEMDRHNMDARYMLEQVNLELSLAHEQGR